MSTSDFLEAAIGNHFYNGIPAASPASVWVALFTTATDDADAGGVEVSGTNYSRVEVTAGFTVTSPAGTYINNVDIVFPLVGVGGWGTIVGVATYDAALGNLLDHGLVIPNRLLVENDVFQFAIGSLVIQKS